MQGPFLGFMPKRSRPLLHFPKLVADPMQGLDAFSLGLRRQFISVVEGPPQRKGALVGHVSNPDQVARRNRCFCIVDASDHAVCAVHQKRDGAVVNFNPFSRVRVLQETSKGKKHAAVSIVIEYFDDDRCTIHENHGPGAVGCHFKEGSIDVEINFQIRLKLFEERRNVLSAHWPAFADAPFVGHAGG